MQHDNNIHENYKCKFCPEKAFISEKYLEEHYARRHPNYESKVINDCRQREELKRIENRIDQLEKTCNTLMTERKNPNLNIQEKNQSFDIEKNESLDIDRNEPDINQNVNGVEDPQEKKQECDEDKVLEYPYRIAESIYVQKKLK